MYKGLGLNKEAQDQLDNPYTLNQSVKESDNNTVPSGISPYGITGDNILVGGTSALISGNIAHQAINKANGQKGINPNSPDDIYAQLKRNPFVSKKLNAILAPVNKNIDVYKNGHFGYEGRPTDIENIRQMLFKIRTIYPSDAIGTDLTSKNINEARRLANLADPSNKVQIPVNAPQDWGDWNPTNATPEQQQAVLKWVKKNKIATPNINTTETDKAVKNAVKVNGRKALKSATQLNRSGKIIKGLSMGAGGITGWLGMGALKDLVIEPLLRNKRRKDLSNN